MKLEFYFDLMLQLNWLKCLLLAFFCRADRAGQCLLMNEPENICSL